MNRYLRTLILMVITMTTLSVSAQEAESFSRRMNKIKRTGSYIYAESMESTEDAAKNGCNAMLTVEISKYLDSQGNTGGRIIKDLSAYKIDYISENINGRVRMFGYVSKENIERDNQIATANATTVLPTIPSEPQSIVTESEIKTYQPEAVENEDPSIERTQTIADRPKQSQTHSVTLYSTGLQLAKWQLDMLTNIASQPEMAQVKKILNQNKIKNRIKRMGDNNTYNTRKNDTFYLIVDASERPMALLAPSDTYMHYNMMSGTEVDINNYREHQYLWFQISK